MASNPNPTPPFDGDGDGNGPFGNSSPPYSTPNTNSIHINIPMLALGLALTAFLLVCLSVCLCTYRRGKARNRLLNKPTPGAVERGSYVGLGLGLDDRSPIIIVKDEDKETKVGEEIPPPAYTPKQTATAGRQTPTLTFGASSPSSSTTPNPLPSLSPSPALAVPLSPALSSYSLSPALSQGESEEARLLGARRSLTPPPPTYAR